MFEGLPMRLSLLTPLLVALALLTACGSLSGERDETTGWSVEKLYGEAHDLLASKDWAKSIKYYEKLEARFPYGRFAQQAQVEMAYAHWKNADRAQAIATADRFLKTYPNHPNSDYVYYLKGLVNFSETQGVLSYFAPDEPAERDPKALRESFAAFKELVARFPNSKYAEDSASRMRFLLNTLAGGEVHVARYYMKRGAYVAAANRAQYAVQNYPQAPAIEEAVFVLVKAYDALGIPELRDAADRVMRTNFPNSKYLSPGGGKRDVPWWKLWDPEW